MVWGKVYEKRDSLFPEGLKIYILMLMICSLNS